MSVLVSFGPVGGLGLGFVRQGQGAICLTLKVSSLKRLRVAGKLVVVPEIALHASAG